jgi:crotonobetainyl-CoA:carnitine CoA-transferase CaiB-like acyl-CoA transferase
MDREPVGFHMYPTLAYSRAGDRPLAETPAPLLGQHTDDVLAALGITAEERARLSELGVTGRLLANV